MCSTTKRFISFSYLETLIRRDVEINQFTNLLAKIYKTAIPESVIVTENNVEYKYSQKTESLIQKLKNRISERMEEIKSHYIIINEA